MEEVDTSMQEGQEPSQRRRVPCAPLGVTQTTEQEERLSSIHQGPRTKGSGHLGTVSMQILNAD